MHITAYCPECQSRYQLNADMIGRKMRCTTAGCRSVFVVREATGGPPRDGTNGPRAADARGELVVPLGRDRPAKKKTAAPAPEFDWRDAPPPVQGKERNLTPPAPLTEAGRGEEDLTSPLQYRFGKGTEGLGDSVLPADETRRFRGKIIVTLFLLLIIGVVGTGAYYVAHTLAHDEEIRRSDAAKEYAAGKFDVAAKKYRELAEKYGGSTHAPDYRLLADLSDLRAAADRTPPDPAAALVQAQAFVGKYDATDPKLKPHFDDVSRALVAIVEGFAVAAREAISTADAATTVPDLIRQGRQALELLRRYPPKDSTQIAGRSEQFDKIGDDFAKAQGRRQSIDQVLKLLDGPRPDVTGARRLAMLRGVADDPIVIAALQAAEGRLRELVVYEPLNKPPQETGPLDGPPVLLLDTATGPLRPAQEVVLAVARGLLYALDSRDGRRLWACRVGLDAGELPARVPAAGDDPELVLVATSDPPGLTARLAQTGAVVWHQPLAAPCLGRPVPNIAGRLFVPTAGPDGQVYDLDARTGYVHGRFVTCQPLAGGGAFDAATRRLYVPAHGQSVFVFSYGAEGPRCEGLLPTGHPAGSLRGEPIVVSGEEGLDVARYLVLGQADGLAAMTLRAFRLHDVATKSPVMAEVRLPGWSWFPPYHDPETIALVTDAGAIGLFGIQQKGDADPPLFPLLGDAVDSRTTKPQVAALKPARAQLVHASESGFWVLADGVMRHWRLGLTRRGGRQLAAAWADGVRLGSPLHAAQVSADRHTLFVVTQTDAPPSYRATAVNADTGDIIWQRPLGLAIQGDPIELGGAVIVLDQSGGLYRFDPTHHPADAKEPWQAGGREIEKPAADLIGTPFLLPVVVRASRLQEAGGTPAPQVAAWAVLVRPQDGGHRLTLRRVAADGAVTSGQVNLPAPLAGTPALGPNAIVLPLADGQLCRVTLDAENPTATLGPTWRALGERPDVRGHVVHWKGDEFLVSDGGRRLMRLSWPPGSHYDLDAQLELAQRIVGPPARLSDSSIAVADAGGTVTLIRGERPTVVRTWRFGPVTAGPWAVGDKLAVVVDRRKLVLLNPDTDKEVWTYAKIGDGVESLPHLIDGKLIVADLAGRFVALDPATGKEMGRGYQFPAEAAPAASVVEFGPGRLFAPLTDGTVLLLPVAELTKEGERRP